MSHVVFDVSAVRTIPCKVAVAHVGAAQVGICGGEVADAARSDAVFFFGGGRRVVDEACRDGGARGLGVTWSVAFPVRHLVLVSHGACLSLFGT